MLTTNTSVLARRIWIDSEHTTLPYEAGWASEAVFFTLAREVREGVRAVFGIELVPEPVLVGVQL